MIDLEGFNQLVQALRVRGLDEATAQNYAALIGDTPEIDSAGNWVIRDEQGKMLATITPILDETGFLYQLINEIMAQGYDRKTAGRYAVLIGDTPIVDKAGNVVVMDGSRVIATLKPLPIFQAN